MRGFGPASDSIGWDSGHMQAEFPGWTPEFWVREVTQLGLGWSFSCVPAAWPPLIVQLIDPIQVELVEVGIEVN